MAAKVYAAPSSIKEPEFVMTDGRYNREASDAENDRYEAEVKAYVNSHGGTGEYAGEIISFPFADGSADYMVWKLRPLTLIHMNWGDAWNADRILMNGLTASDVKEKVENSRRIKELFSRKADA